MEPPPTINPRTFPSQRRRLPQRDRNILLLNALGDMTWQNPESFELLLRQPWFTNGLDAEERAFIIGLQKMADPGLLYHDFLKSRSVLRSQTSGIDIWVFHHSADLSYGGVNFADSMSLAVAPEWKTMTQGLLDHEVSHYYLAGDVGPLWLVEGGANFAKAYLEATREDRRLIKEEWALEECERNGVPNVHALANPNPPDAV